MDFIWNIFQQQKIREAEKRIDDLELKNRDIRDNTEDYSLNVQRLALATQAVWSFLKEKHHLDEQDLLQRIEEIDLSDGRRDGKVAAQVVVCSSCRKNLNSRHTRCIYCGTQNPEFNPFSK